MQQRYKRISEKKKKKRPFFWIKYRAVICYTQCTIPLNI